MKKTTLWLLTLVMLLVPTLGLGEAPAEPAATEIAQSALFADTDIPVFALSSEDLQDGVWDVSIGKKVDGKTPSPQLSWEPVPEAGCYVIYMVDTNVMDFMHWMSNNVTETTLPKGWADATAYVGPYPPPQETHTYDVYVIALRQPVEDLKSILNTANVFFAKNVMYLDAPAEGVTDNILAYGYLSGTYTSGN